MLFLVKLLEHIILKKGTHIVQVIKMQNFLGFLVANADGATDAAMQAGGIGAMISSFLPLIIMIAIFYFMLIRPQQKREKQFRAMLAALKVGDQILTNSGIEGRIVSVKEDDIVIETGADRIKLTFKKWAVKEVTTQQA